MYTYECYYIAFDSLPYILCYDYTYYFIVHFGYDKIIHACFKIILCDILVKHNTVWQVLSVKPNFCKASISLLNSDICDYYICKVNYYQIT